MPASPPIASVLLPEVLDRAASTRLAHDLLTARGRGVVLDASQVRRLGGLGLQVLMAARRAWAADGQPFRVDTPSPAFVEALSLLGARPFQPGPETTDDRA